MFSYTRYVICDRFICIGAVTAEYSRPAQFKTEIATRNNNNIKREFLSCMVESFAYHMSSDPFVFASMWVVVVKSMTMLNIRFLHTYEHINICEFAHYCTKRLRYVGGGVSDF